MTTGDSGRGPVAADATVPADPAAPGRGIGSDPDPDPAAADRTAPATPAHDHGRESLPPRPARSTWSRRSARGRAALVITAVAGLLTGMMLLLAIGMWRNDMVIDATPVRATATVLTVSALSTGIEFVDNTGVSQRPPNGVLYPGGLAVGQLFVVEYAASDPTLVRVAGRSAVNGLVMPGLVIAGTWIVAGPARWLLLRSRDGRPLRRGPWRRWRERRAAS